jgi:hypothetical protein
VVQLNQSLSYLVNMRFCPATPTDRCGHLQRERTLQRGVVQIKNITGQCTGLLDLTQKKPSPRNTYSHLRKKVDIRLMDASNVITLNPITQGRFADADAQCCACRTRMVICGRRWIFEYGGVRGRRSARRLRSSCFRSFRGTRTLCGG